MSNRAVVDAPELRRGAIGIVEGSFLAIASTAPAYSLAVTIGLLAAAVGDAAPLALALVAIPVTLVAFAFRELNRAEPDCGTCYRWVARAFGARTGWLTGWAVIMACVLVMSNLAQVGAIYLLDALGFDSLVDNRLAQALVGAALVLILAYVAYRGIELAARVQAALVIFELAALAYFVVVAFGKSGGHVSFSGEGDWTAAFLAGVFIYWGWDSALSINEESTDPRNTPGRAGIISNVALVAVYVVVAMAALSAVGAEATAAVEDEDFFAVLSDQLFNSFGGTLLALAILTSALASAQTTIIPTARTMLSMARDGRMPAAFARIHPRFQTPSVATWAFTGVSLALYVVLLLISENVLYDAIEATAILIALYYMTTCLAVPFYFRGQINGARDIAMRIVLPTLAGLTFAAALVAVIIDTLGVPVIVASLCMALGVVTMLSIRRPPVVGAPA